MNLSFLKRLAAALAVGCAIAAMLAMLQFFGLLAPHVKPF
jgi:hypothetical protein